MKNIAILIFTIACLVILAPKTASADGFVVHLYFNSDSNNLSFDKESPQNITLDKTISPSVVEFARNNDKGEYTLKLYDTTLKILASTEFDKKNGAFTVVLPYYSLADKLRIFNTKNHDLLLEADLSSFTKCNGNNICEVEKGETSQNCIGDCGNKSNSYSEQTKKLLEENNGVIKNPDTGNIELKDNSFSKQTKNSWLTIIVATSILIASGAIYYFYKKRKNS